MNTLYIQRQNKFKTVMQAAVKGTIIFKLKIHMTPNANVILKNKGGLLSNEVNLYLQFFASNGQ